MPVNSRSLMTAQSKPDIRPAMTNGFTRALASTVATRVRSARDCAFSLDFAFMAGLRGESAPGTASRLKARCEA